MIPASAGDALGMLTSGLGYLAGTDPAQLPAATLAEYLGVLEQADAITAAARGKILAAFRAQDGHLADGQRSARTWLVHCLGITRGQAAEHLAVAAVARQHPRLLAGLREGYPLTRSVALQLARWLKDIPPQFRDQAEELLAGAVQAGADLAALAAIYAELRTRTAPPDSDRERDPDLDNGVSLDTTLDGAGVLRGISVPSARRWCRRSWTRCRPRPGRRTGGVIRSGSMTRWPRR